MKIHYQLVRCAVNMFHLKDKIVLLTGGANGIGAAMVKKFLQEGVKHIAALDIDESSGIALENEMNKTYEAKKVKFYKCDVSNDEELLNTFKNVHERNHYIDVVVNNAGLADESSTSAIRSEIEVNYREEYYSKTGVRVITICFGNTDSAIMHKLKSFDTDINKEIQKIIELYPMQSKELSAAGVVDAFKKGKSGSTWLVSNDKPAVDYSSHVNDAYSIMAKHLND